MRTPAYQPFHPTGLSLRLTGDRLAVCRLPAADALPGWALDAPGFLSLARTADELSIVCASDRVPVGVRHEASFRLLQVAGPLPFDAVGIMAGLSAALAAAGISLVAVGTFDTDYLLVRETDVDRAVAALRDAGCTVDQVATLAGPPAAPGSSRDGADGL